MPALVLRLDHVMRAWIVLHRLPLLDGVMWVLSVVGRGGMVWVPIVVALVAARRLPWQAIAQLALALLLTSLVVDKILKPMVDRTRPYVIATEAPVIGGRPDDSSFPSGHAANSAAGAFVLSRLVPGGRFAWWTLALAIGYSRVYLGVHYPLDVVCGAIVGLICSVVVVAGISRLSRPKSVRTDS
jgi:undecaprenyl-diphosphatase